MSYHALLFCPDEKTARTVTQVLSELEFEVEPCAEPFAAVKRLMSGHFDAVVVDCENEQNATLLFKSARNSTANQGSLAVAVVEGQAGVAKAFRIGANLVLTKPINVEQAKGTLRVARGLLRKGEPGKPAAVAPSTPLPEKKSGETVVAAPKPATQPTPARVSRPVAAASATRTIPRPVPPTSLAAAQTARAQAVAESHAETNGSSRATLPGAFPLSGGIQPVPKPAPLPIAPAVSVGSGAASAPAPARAAQDTVIKEAPPAQAVAAPAPSLPLDQKLDPKVGGEAPAASPAPSFTFGGTNTPQESRGGNKKVIIGFVAAAAVAAAAYVGWTQFHRKSSASATKVSAPAPATAQHPAAPAPTSPASATAAPSPSTSAAISVEPIEPSDSQPAEQPSAQPSAPSQDDEDAAPAKHASAASTASTKPSGSGSSSPSNKTAKASAQPAGPQPIVVQPIVVKNGTSALPAKSVAADAPAPSLAGIPTTGSGGSLSNLVSSEPEAPKPVLQTLSISQGVSQGLILKRVQPTYPSAALRMRMEGSVELVATISKTGDITSVKALKGEPLLTRPAIDAVKQWKYKPYLLNGEPVEIQTQITVVFKLPK